MTRFARKGGINEKKEDKKKKEEATEWNDMFTDQTEFGQNKIEQKIENSHFERHRNFASNEKFNHKFKSNDDFALRKYYKLLDREIVDELVDLKNKRKISNREMFEKLEREVRSNKRRERRQVERENKRVCYKCRKPGHSVNECPQIDNDTEQGTGICYKCGSTEHSVYNCKVKVEPGKYPYAKCFICNEIGHITKQCPDNPRGLYPNGGCCKICASVEHYSRDCPEAQKQNASAELKTVKVIKAKQNLDELSDTEISTTNNDKSTQKNNKKVVVFK